MAQSWSCITECSSWVRQFSVNILLNMKPIQPLSTDTQSVPSLCYCFQQKNAQLIIRLQQNFLTLTN